MFIDAMRNQAEIQFQSEVDELGGMEKAKERIGKVKKWAKASFTDETYQYIFGSAVTSEFVKFLEEVRSKTALQTNPPDEGVDGKPEQLTEDDLRGIIASEEYKNSSHPKHKETVKKVEEGYKRLYPGEQG